MESLSLSGNIYDVPILQKTWSETLETHCQTKAVMCYFPLCTLDSNRIGRH